MGNALSRPRLELLRGLWKRPQRFGAAALVFLLCLAVLQWGVPALGIPAYILAMPSQVLS